MGSDFGGDMFALMKKEEEQKETKLYLPKTLDLANSLFLAFIKKNNLVGLKLAILFSGARGQIEYDQDNKVKLNVEQLCDLLQIEKRQLSNHLKTVATVHFTYVTNEGLRGGTTPFHSYEYINRNKEVVIEVSSKAKSLFTELEKGKYSFNQASAANLMSLKHKHSLRMRLLLELINNFDDDIAKRKHYTLEHLNAYFGVNYRNYYDFETKILKPIKEEIDGNSKLTFTYQLVDEKPDGTGRPKIKEVIIDLIDRNNYQGRLCC